MEKLTPIFIAASLVAAAGLAYAHLWAFNFEQRWRFRSLEGQAFIPADSLIITNGDFSSRTSVDLPAAGSRISPP